ncbi:MAG: hypothetical protein Q9220_000371 [cf. Caloplaca sp. 1 TL-2023]
MATAARSRTSNANRREPSTADAFPAYQPLAHPLNPTAQHTLQNLSTAHAFNDLKRRLHTAANHLTEITGDLNDQYQIKRTDHDRQKARRAARAKEFEISSQGTGNGDDDEESERRIDDAWKDVDAWTTKMDEGVRRVIDVQARLEGAETAFKDLNSNVAQGRTATQSTLGASQFRTQSQRQRRRRQQQQNPEDMAVSSDTDDDNDDALSPVATADSTTTTQPPALTVFRDKLLASSIAYTSLSLRNRYASHNDYIAFRKIVHDARHPNDDTPLPHSSTWFPQPHQPSSSLNKINNRSATRSMSHEAPSEEEDDDIQIAHERLSLRCPLTLLPITSPLSSTLCPHSFEKSAILSVLSLSTLTITPTQATNGRKVYDKCVQCPECECLLTEATLRVDAVMVRRVERARREREGVGGWEGDEGEERQSDGGEGDREARGKRRKLVEEVGSSPVVGRESGGGRGLKREGKGRGGRDMKTERRGGRDVSVVMDSQRVVDLGEEEEEEEEEGEETE